MRDTPAVRILVVEDQPELRAAVVRRLRAEADLLFRAHDYALVVLDRGLPDGDGLDSMRRWRRAGSSVPVLVLTARDAIADRVSGLADGADDYLVKPFAMDELVARVAVIARRGVAGSEQVSRVGDLELDHGRAQVRRAGVLLPLRPKEFAVLAYLCARPGRVISRAQLREACWDEGHEPGSNVEEVVVSALRRKLGPPALIRTRRGLGYVLDG